MSAGALARRLVIAVDITFLVVTVALLPRLRREVREMVPGARRWLFIVLTLGPLAVFRLIYVVVSR
jgi:cell division protein FtsW (lipid II flippase)